MIIFSLGYSTAVCIFPYLRIWGKFSLEGLLVFF